jgi:HlyD family secretion protein
MLKKTIAILLSLAGLNLVAACSAFGPEPTPTPVVSEPVQQPQVVSAEAFVVPNQEADLAFETPGRLASLEVEEGEEVEQGDVLAQLEDSTQQAALAEAQASLAQAEAGVAEAQAQLAAAVSQLAEAEAQLAQIKAGPTEEEIAQVQALLARAEAALAQVVIGPTPEEIAEAQARLASAQAELNRVRAPSRAEDLKAKAAQLLQAEADVRQAQDDYDQVRYGDPDDVLVVGVQLEKATLEYERLKAEYDRLVNGATPEEIAIAQAGVGEAQAGLASAQAGATPEEIAQAQADVASAEADLAQLMAGATDEEIAIEEARVATAEVGVETARAGLAAAEANVEAGEAQVASAQVALDQTVLEAPFSGIVGSLNNINEGEIIQNGQTVISLGNPNPWQIETDDLTEIDIVQVQIGAEVTISVDALPGEEFKGEVVRITPKAETKAGDQTYTVRIDITEGDTSRLRWGMTTFVDIEADTGIDR